MAGVGTAREAIQRFLSLLNDSNGTTASSVDAVKVQPARRDFRVRGRSAGTMELSVSIARDFEQESHRIDQMIWDAMALLAGESVLFCGFSNNVEWIKRGVEIGAAVTVISSNSADMREFNRSAVTVLRGSTSMLPARDASFDAAIAFHYLHEVDPFFQASVVAELARVGKRCVIVEPAPPSDPLGLRIASLYSRAKRELGQFENYHQIDHWRKLLALAKPEVTAQTFAFTRSPPAQAMKDTVALLIDTMAAEDTPEHYMQELRALAARPDAKLLPQARYVIVGTSTGKAPGSHLRTDFRARPAQGAVIAPKPFTAPTLVREPHADHTITAPTLYSSADAPEFPVVVPPVPARGALAPQAAPASRIARNAFGLSPLSKPPADPLQGPPSNASAGDEPFGGSEISATVLPADFGWTWEPPEENGGL